MAEEDALLPKLVATVDALIERVRCAEPGDVAKLTAGVRNLAGSINELKSAQNAQPQGMAAYMHKLTELLEKQND